MVRYTVTVNGYENLKWEITAVKTREKKTLKMITQDREKQENLLFRIYIY